MELLRDEEAWSTVKTKKPTRAEKADTETAESANESESESAPVSLIFESCMSISQTTNASDLVTGTRGGDEQSNADSKLGPRGLPKRRRGPTETLHRGATPPPDARSTMGL